MKRRHVAAGFVAVTTAVGMAGAGAGMASAASGDHRVKLSNSGAPRTLGGESVKFSTAATTGRRMSLSLQLPLRNQASLTALLNKGTVITPAEYARRFGASEAQMTKTRKWAKDHGFTVTSSSVASGQVFVSGSVRRVNSAFGVTVRNARLGTTTGLAVQASPSVPASLGLVGVSGLNTVHRVAPASHRISNTKTLKIAKSTKGSKTTHIKRDTSSLSTAKATSSDGSTSCSKYWGQHLYATAKKYSQETNIICGYTPSQLVQMYGAKSAQTKAPSLGLLLWGNDTKLKTTANNFFSKQGYPTLSNYKTVTDKATTECDSAYDEQALDVEASHAISPKSAITYYGAADCLDGSLTKMFQKAVDQHTVTTLSMSFGTSSDAGMTSADIAAWARPMQQASATGISVFASSGDNGTNKTASESGASGVGTPASFPLVTAVGGTAVGLDSKGAQPVLAGWENRLYQQDDPTTKTFKDVTFSAANLPVAGAGGGVSSRFAQPAWQKGVVTGSSTKRMVPDVSALADPSTGALIAYTENGKSVTTGIGGTSLASPLTAAMVGLAKAKNNLKLGNAAPVFYKIAKSSGIKDVNAPNSAGVFWALPSGETGVYGFDAKPESLVSAKGWDNVTGVGTPSGSAFYTSFK